MGATADSVSDVVSAAMGDSPADTILEDCSLFSVYTGEVIPSTQVAIRGDRIAYVGPDASHARGQGTRIIDVGGRPVSPGFADPHVHIDQFVMPSEFAKEALLRGVTSLFSDPIDVTSVAGYRGFGAFLDAGRNLPIRIFQTVPGGLPVDPRFSRRGAGGITPARQAAAVARNADVVGMGEVFSWTKVTGRDPLTMRSISGMINQNSIINGHTAGASGRKLAAYVAAGIISCHEPIDFGQAAERLRLGMWVMIREGSIRRDLDAIMPRILSDGIRLDRLMFCSDGLDPAAIRTHGYIDYCIRQAVRLGVGPVDAVSMATRNVAAYYNMERDMGVVAPGRLADILVLADDRTFRPDMVMVGGKLVVSDGRLAVRMPPSRMPQWIRRTVWTPRLSARDFEVRPKRGRAASHANTIVLKTEIITGMGSAEVVVDGDGRVTPHPDRPDVWKVAAFDRTRRGGRRAIGFLEGFGGEVGAFASTWSFHENDMIVMGSDDAAMAGAANHLIRHQGGVVVVSHNGSIAASMPLQYAGIVSTAPFDRVLEQFGQINDALADAGCRLERPLLVPLFLPFLALPSIRMTSGGMVDVKRGAYVEPLRA